MLRTPPQEFNVQIGSLTPQFVVFAEVRMIVKEIQGWGPRPYLVAFSDPFWMYHGCSLPLKKKRLDFAFVSAFCRRRQHLLRLQLEHERVQNCQGNILQ